MDEASTVALYWGDDEFLLKLAATVLLDERGLQATEVSAAEWRGGETSDLATPSLWGEWRALLVSRCEALPEPGLRELKAYLGAPAPDALCLLTVVTRGKGPPPLAKVVQGAGGTVRHVALKRQDLPAWVGERARVRGVKMSRPAAVAVVGSIGEDTAALDQAVQQLAAAFSGRVVGPDEVHAQFQGLGEQRVWDLCDQALTGRLPEALVTLRALFEAKEDPLLILGGIASRVRDLVRVRGLPERMPSVEAARAAGIRFEWQIRRYREQAARFTTQDLARLHGWVTEADRALKGGVAGDVVLTSLVAVMAGEREAALDVPVRVSR
jgi:DNA polymerase-3 subunit delta